MFYIDTAMNVFRTVPHASRAILAALFTIGVSVAEAAGPSVVTLPGKQAYPESITSTGDGTLYVGGYATGGVLRVRPGAAQAEPWIKPGAFGSRSTMGVLADKGSNMLWVCSNDVSARGVPGPGSARGSALKGFDLTTGAGKVSAAFPGTRTFCNDIAVGPDKSVYVTNTLAPEILVLRPGSKALQVWAKDPRFEPPEKGGGLDGLAFGSDGNLYVDTFTKSELFRVDVTDAKAGRITKLQTSRPIALPDGLRSTAGHAFLMAEGVGNVDRVVINGDTASIETLRTGLDRPTGVTQVGSTVWVSEGQISYLTDPTKKGQGPRLPFRLYAVDLPADLAR
jgi:sugar lactone lactonase YvrE